MEPNLDLFKFNFATWKSFRKSYLKPAYSRLYCPAILKSRYSTFASPRLSIFIVFVSGVFSPLTYIYIYIAFVEFECYRFSRIGKLFFSSTSYKPTSFRQPAANRTPVPYCLQSDLHLVCRQADICFVFALLSWHRGKRHFHSDLLRISLAYFHPLCLSIFDLVNIMPSSSKSPQAPSTKSHSFLRKSTDESPSKTTSTSVPSEVRTS